MLYSEQFINLKGKNRMQFYLAPMEGITGYVYRNTYAEYFGDIDKYFTPFVAPTHTKSFLTKEIKDTAPENNEGLLVVPQILTNDAELFLWAANEMWNLGYREINFNLGCPSKTVSNKGRGSGFLIHTKELEDFLNRIFEEPKIASGDLAVSVKTRTGRDSHEEFEHLLSLYNRYPLKELIVHPRTRSDFYGNHPNMEAYRLAYEGAEAPLCYNGDICGTEDLEKLLSLFPNTDCVMIGRGILSNPALVSRLKGEKEPAKETIRGFHDTLCRRYQETLSGDANVLHRMKELWFYWAASYPEAEKTVKKIRKCSRLCEYLPLAREILS